MKSFFIRIFGPGANPVMTSAGLLVLRVWLGLTMLLNHGWDKLTGFKEMAGQFPEILPIGASANLGLAVFAEVFCSALLVFGLLTRFAAAMLVATMSVAFFIAHKGALSGAQSGEMAFIYLAGYVCLLLAGPGRLSADAMFFKGKR
jgi:putative oxidoreductase